MVELRRFERSASLPPSSSGPGRGPLKAKTGVRVPVGAQAKVNCSTEDVGRFLSSIRFESKGKLAELGVEIGTKSAKHGK